MSLSPGGRWIAGVVTTLTGGVIAIVVLIVFAQRATAGRIVPNYYKRAAAYDGDIATANASRALGWTASVGLTTAGAQVCLRDRAGQPLTAHVDVVAAHRAHPASPGLGGGATATDGCATIGMALTLGIHDVTVTADAGDQHWSATAAREVK